MDDSDGAGDGDDDYDGDGDGDDDDGDDKVKPHPSHAEPTAPAVQKINNPDTVSTSKNRNTAYDIEYFYLKTETARICKECQ